MVRPVVQFYIGQKDFMIELFSSAASWMAGTVM